MAYVLPQVQVFQEFAQVASVITQPLRAFITGPHYYLSRYTATDEKELGNLGAYQPDAANTAYLWPLRPTGGIVDQSFTKVFIDKANLQYLDVSTGVEGVASNPNYVRMGAGTTLVSGKGLVAYTNPTTNITYARDTVLLPSRDVQVGDVVNVRDSSSSDTITAKVTGFAHDMVAATVGTSTVDAGNDSTVEGKSVTAGSGNSSGGNTLAAVDVDVTSYDGRADGDTTETYTITVTLGGAGAAARASVVSASGHDDVASLVLAPIATPVTISSRGATLTFQNGTADNFIVGDSWTVVVSQTFTASTATSSGGYTGPSDTTYIATVSKGGDSGTAEITVSSTTGIDSSGPHVVTTGSAISIGSYGTTLTLEEGGTDGFSKGDRFYVPVTAETPGAITTLILSKNLTANMQTQSYAGDMAMTLFIEKDVEVPACDALNPAQVVSWTQSATQLILNGSIKGYDTAWTDSGGLLVGMQIRSGTVYVHYRALLQTYTTAVQTITDISDVSTLLGKSEVDNPLALAVSKAIGNANGTDVKYMAVPTNDAAGYSKVLEALVGREDVYGLVPLTFNKAIQDSFAAHVDASSAPTVGRWRLGWFGSQAVTTKQVGAEFQGTITDDPNTTGTQYTWVQFQAGTTGTFLTDGVVAGDIIRTNFSTDLCGVVTYDEYQIDSVENEETVRLVTGPGAAIGTAQKMEVWHNNSKDEQAVDIGKLAGAFSNRRNRMVWPDSIGNGGVQMSSYYAAAALAGLRSGVVPHQGLTNVELAGFDDVRIDYFNFTQLNTMAAAGVWIVTQDPATGKIFTRHQVTTGDTAILNDREDSVVTNVDSISFYFLNSLAPFIGKANVTPEMLALLHTQIMSGISFLKVNGFTSTLGGQLIDAEIKELKQHPTLQDHVIVKLLLTVPKPVNVIEITLTVG